MHLRSSTLSTRLFGGQPSFTALYVDILKFRVHSMGKYSSSKQIFFSIFISGNTFFKSIDEIADVNKAIEYCDSRRSIITEKLYNRFLLIYNRLADKKRLQVNNIKTIKTRRY